MYSFLYDEMPNISDLGKRYFTAHASCYVVKVQEFEAENNSLVRSASPNTLSIDLKGTIQQAKSENQDRQAQITAASNMSSKAAGYSVSSAQQYAEAYALKWNPVFGVFSSDCTNFASQIVYSAGMQPIRDQWQWNGTDLARRTWNVAHTFAEYWGIERGYNGGDYVYRSDVKANANAGDFLAYMSKETYAIWHICFVQRKVNGKLYISQHTTNRYNEDWDTIGITNSTYIIVDFT